MLDAHDKLAVLNWSERQLGAAARKVAIVELTEDAGCELVEKSGTGVQRSRCEPFLSVMPDSIQQFSEAGGEVGYDQISNLGQNMRLQKCVVH